MNGRQVVVFLSLVGAFPLACRRDVGPACEAYIDCAYGAGIGEQTDLAYGEGSPCWENSEAAASCETGCATALTASEAPYPLVEACDSGDGVLASEAFANATRWTMVTTDFEATPPCNDFAEGEGDWEAEPGSGAEFTMEGFIMTELGSIRWETPCTLQWGGFTCESWDAGHESIATLEGYFTPDLFNVNYVMVLDSVDLDTEVGEELECSYTYRMSGTIAG
jgi:hypothetical protein